MWTLWCSTSTETISGCILPVILKTVSLSYRFNLKSRIIRELEATCSGENLYLWSTYNGFDPDVSSGGINGYDNSYYPKPMRVVFSILMKY